MTVHLLDTDVPLTRRQKVVATTDLPGVPEGTPGKVLLINGFEWTRYRVLFDNGVDIGSLDRKYLGSPDEYAELQRKRASGELDVVETDTADAGADDGGGAAAESSAEDKVVNGVTVPGRLLAMSKAARERLGAT